MRLSQAREGMHVRVNRTCPPTPPCVTDGVKCGTMGQINEIFRGDNFPVCVRLEDGRELGFKAFELSPMQAGTHA